MQSSQAADPVVLNVVIPLTGGGAFLGKAEEQALGLAAKLINGQGGIKGRDVRFEIQDDQSKPQVTVQLANKVKASRAPIILGSTLTGACNAEAPLMRNGPFMYCFSPSIHPEAGSYVFTSNVSTYDLQRSLITYFRARGWKKIAFIAASDASGQDAERGIKQALSEPQNSDVKIVAQFSYNPRDVSVSAQLERIKAAQPDVLIAWSTGAAVATIFKGISEAGLTIPVATTNGNMTHAQMDAYAAFLPKDLVIASSVWPGYRSDLKELDAGVQKAQADFFKQFDAAGVAPDLGAVNVWDAVMIVVDALRKVGPDATAAQVKDYVAGITDFPGINGRYDFKKTPQRGLDERAAVVTRWNPDKNIWQVVSHAGGAPLK
jgi:branched-chain amino acid transport system substrate-binding protein